MAKLDLVDGVIGGLSHGAVWEQGGVVAEVEAFAAIQSGDPAAYLDTMYTDYRARARNAGKILLESLTPGTLEYNRALTNLKTASQALLRVQPKLELVRQYPTNTSYVARASALLRAVYGHVFNIELLVGDAKAQKT